MWQISVVLLSLALVALAVVALYLYRRLVKISEICSSIAHLDDIDGYI